LGGGGPKRRMRGRKLQKKIKSMLYLGMEESTTCLREGFRENLTRPLRGRSYYKEEMGGGRASKGQA